MGRAAALVVAAMLLPTQGLAGPAPAVGVDSVSVDQGAGDLHLHLRDGRTVAAPKERDQKTLTDPALAGDGRTLGWLANYDTCCQSYPIPQQLVIWRSGRVIRRIDAAAMIWRWRFYNNGREVGFADGPTHGSHIPYSYKLYDVATGRLIREIAGNSKLSAEWAKLLLPPPAARGHR
jgi:hypothetical protein